MTVLNVMLGYKSKTYYPISGNKLPTLGSQSATWPPSGWTSILDASNDDNFYTIIFPFNFRFNNTSRSSIFIGTNFYMTFASGASVFSGLSSTNPANDKIMFNAGDRSAQRIAYKNAPDNSYTRIRFEGATGTSGTPGASPVIFEMTFFNPVNTANVPHIELLTGRQDSTGGVTGFYTLTGTNMNSSFGSTYGFSADTSYVFYSTSTTGNFWSTTPGYIVNTDY